jgi:hypothetical protein
MTMRNFSISSAAVALLLLAAGPAQANPFDDLKGSWRGGGTISPLGGKPERVSCRATYGGAGASLTQQLTCNAASFSIQISANMNVSAEKLSGSWSEARFGASGNVSGLARGNTILARISGAKFNGRMNINVSRGGHSIALQQTDPGSGKLMPVANLKLSR